MSTTCSAVEDESRGVSSDEEEDCRTCDELGKLILDVADEEEDEAADADPLLEGSSLLDDISELSKDDEESLEDDESVVEEEDSAVAEDESGVDDEDSALNSLLDGD